MNPDNDLHMFALHWIFLPRINQTLDEFLNGWNHHPIRTENNRSPLAIWTEGFYNLSGTTGSDLMNIT